MDAFGGKNKKKINMEWRGSQHAVSAEGLGEGAVCHPPGMRQGTPRGSPGPGRPLDLRHQHGTLLYSPQNMGCGSGIEGRGGGKN